MNRKVTIRVRTVDSGSVILNFLSRRFTYHDRNTWNSLILEGKVMLNNGPCLPDTVLCPEDTISYLVVEAPEPPVDMNYILLHEDEELIVVSKPGNLPCHPAGRYFKNTLWYLLSSRYGHGSIHFVNRIDRETSGLVLVAKTPSAAREFGRLFAEGTVIKRYLVAVFGEFPMQPLSVEGRIDRDLTSPVKKKQRFFTGGSHCPEIPGARWCRTDFNRIWSNRGLSLLSAEPKTGRTHQIRATLFSLGYPVVGDKIYGPDDSIFLRFIDCRVTAADRDLLLLPRQALHAESLELLHPSTGCKMIWTAPLPDDMAGLH